MDITLCGNSEKCKRKSKCLRYIGKPDNLYQSYSDFYKYRTECDGFWSIDNE